MLAEYYGNYYRPAMAEGVRLKAEGYASSRSLSAYLDRAKSLWPSVAVIEMHDDAPPVIARGTKIHVETTVNLAGLTPDEVRVECYRGPLTSKGDIQSPERTEMSPVSNEGSSLEVPGDRQRQADPAKSAIPSGYCPSIPPWGDRLVPGTCALGLRAA